MTGRQKNRCPVCGSEVQPLGVFCSLPCKRLTAPERIRQWVERQFQAHQVERVFQDLLDVATGNREGNRFEREAVARIFPEGRKP